MPPQPYLIAPIGSGIRRDLEPFLIPEDSFETLEDAYVWRGRLKKRWGYSLMGASQLESRLRIQIDTTDGSGAASGTVPGATFGIGQMFSIGSEIFTVNATGTPATLLATGSSSGTFNTSTGAYVFSGAALTTPVYYYPSTPVMGLLVRENDSTNAQDTIGFDTQFAYRRVANAWQRLGTALWTSSNSDFFWSCNYRGANPYDTNFYVVNGKALSAGSDGINYIPDGSTTWTNLRPQLDSGASRFLEGARIILPFKDRLIVLNTLETDGAVRTFNQRCRFSQNGDPTTAATSWLDDTPGRGGYIDAPTKEEIITAQVLRDRLIVYFEGSTWELVYTKDSILPFYWQQIDGELGAESTFSIIGFDRAAVGVGNRGIHACDGVNVKRIDPQIPDEVFRIHNGNDGIKRVYGIRDYVPEMTYWTFPSSDEDPTFPDRVLVYNYSGSTWAIFNDTFTCFGYFQREGDVTWDDLDAIYGTWDNANGTWDSGTYQSAFPLVAGGNQQGWTVTLDTNKSANSEFLSITDMTPATSTFNVINHNLIPNTYIYIRDATGITSLNDTVVQVVSVTDADNFVIDTEFSGTYTGAGTIERISSLNVRSKMFNPGTPAGREFNIPYVDLYVSRTDGGEFSLDYFINSNTDSSVQELALSGALLGSNVVFSKPEDDSPGQVDQSSIWHRYFVGCDAALIQFRFFLSDTQLRDYSVATSAFEVGAILLYVDGGGRIIG